MTPERPLVLAGEFDRSSREVWLDAVHRVLAKGATDLTPEELDRRFERVLVTPTYDGIPVQPLYTAADAPEAAAAIGFPGLAPFVRGASLLGSAASGWEIRQPLDVRPDGTVGSPTALEHLERGASSLLLQAAPVLPDPVAAAPVAADHLDAALDGVYLELVTIALDPSLDPAGTGGPAAALLDLWRRRGVRPDQAQGVLGLDPIGAYASTGQQGGLGPEVETAGRLAATCAGAYPGVRSVVVDATRYHDAGASDVEELGCAIATGVAYLRLLTEAGLSLEAAFGQLEFRFAATADQFLTIAKLRAARRLWARVAETLGAAGAGAQRQHAVTSRAMLTRYDPWVNLLRNTIACFGAAAGGADAVTVRPHDLLVEAAGASDLGHRMARNTQNVLAEESHLARVVDPAGGSWYVEWLTDAVAQQAWRWFGDIEGAGGMIPALDHRLVQDRIEATWERRLDNLAHRTDTITGVSDFPNPADRVPPTAVEPGSASPGALPRRRYADPFEALRSRTDAYAARHGDKPPVLLLRVGSAAEFTARATYAGSFFETGGFGVVVRDLPDDADDLSGLVADSGARLACVCSSDAVYAERGAAVLGLLKNADLDCRFVAGRPKGLDDDLRAAGADQFIYVGCNVLDVLRDALSVAGVE